MALHCSPLAPHGPSRILMAPYGSSCLLNSSSRLLTSSSRPLTDPHWLLTSPHDSIRLLTGSLRLLNKSPYYIVTWHCSWCKGFVDNKTHPWLNTYTKLRCLGIILLMFYTSSVARASNFKLAEIIYSPISDVIQEFLHIYFNAVDRGELPFVSFDWDVTSVLRWQ